MFKLVISDDEGKTTTVPLVRDEITIGRKEGNTIRLTERNVSRRHARLQKQNGHYLLHDLGSYNGIVINGGRLSDARPLKHGDQILIGDYKLAILEEGTTQVAVPPPPADGFQATIPNAPVPQPSTHSTAPAIPSVMATMQGVAAPATAPASPSQEPGPAPQRISAPPVAPPAAMAAAPLTSNELPDSVRGLRLVFLAPAGTPAPVTLERLPIILGRSEAADVVLPFSSISREHARISYQNDELTIEDLGSSNGVIINGNPTRRGALSTGDLVAMGVVEFRVAARGDSTVVLQQESLARRSGSRTPIIAGVLGGGVVLGVLAFVFMRSPATQPTAAVTPPAMNQETPAPVAAVTSPTPPSAAEPVAPAPAPTVGVANAPPSSAAPTAEPPSPAVEVPVNEPDPVEQALLSEPGSSNRSRDRRSSRDRHSSREPSSPASSVNARSSPQSSSSTSNQTHSASSGNPSSSAGSSTAAASPATGLEAARACRSDSNCIITALRGRATTEQELALLAVTYRAIGQRNEAVAVMRRYLSRFPTGPRASSFQNFLNNQ